MAVTTRVKTAWKKFRELLPVLTSRHLSYKTRGHVYSSCVRSPMLHASETWPLTKTNLQRLQLNDRALIRQIYSIKSEDVAMVRSSELLAKLQLEDLDLILRERRLRWFGHVERSSGAIRTAYDRQIEGRGAGFYTKLNIWGSLGLSFDYDGGPIIENGGPICLYMDPL